MSEDGEQRRNPGDRTDAAEKTGAMGRSDAAETARTYYEAIDAGDYETFADLLAPEVVHERPDRTIDGRETLVEFMRDGRPNKDTSHEVVGVYRRETDDSEVAVEGRLLDSDGEEMFAFVDAFGLRDGRIAEIRTYTH